MSTVNLALLLAAALAAIVGCAVLLALRALNRQVSALRFEWASVPVPPARTPVAPEDTAAAARRRREEIRGAVAEALAEERERELAEARAFWAAQEAREAADSPFADSRGEDLAEPRYHLTRQIDLAPLPGEVLPDEGDGGPLDQQFTDALREAIDELVRDAEAEIAADGQARPEGSGADTGPADASAAPLIAVPDMRRHPSHPDFRPSPAVADQARTTEQLEKLASASVPLVDLRPGPLGTLDIYVFGDGTTLCVTPGDRQATQLLTEALSRGEGAVLMGGSGVGGAYALTFSVGEESVYVLADRVVASL